MQRRKFIQQSAVISSAAFLSPTAIMAESDISMEGKIITVNGPIDPTKMGFCLPHEHVLSRFGAEPAEPGIYDQENAIQQVVPFLKYVKELGVQSIVDCTAAYFGRNVTLLQKLSQQSGVQIITNTGFYGAANDRYVPQIAYQKTPEQIAEIWIDEFKNGIQSTDIKPGFIKTAIDGEDLTAIDAKMVRAAAITHRETGLSIAVHTSGNIVGARESLQIFKEEKVAPQAWIWVHAQNADNPEDLQFAADAGGWISLDGIRGIHYSQGQKQGSNTMQKHAEFCRYFKEKGLLDQLLLSHDGSSYPPEDKPMRPFDWLMNSFIPMLKVAGFTEAEIDKLTVDNPREAFIVRKRLS